ncbi:MAG: HAD hydrolase family protein [Bacilli bacterium]|nr:HAD hydrolase family protein [Bacilli bacterium]
MIKAAFFDVDNTLYDWPTETFVSSGIEAIKRIAKKGVKVFICSARPYASLKEFGVFDLGIHWNGVISNCGAFVTLGRRTLRNLTMDKTKVRKLCRLAKKNHLTMELVTARTRFLIAPGDTFLENYHGTYSDSVPPVHPYLGEGVTGALLFAPEEYDAHVEKEVPGLNLYRFHPYAVDISEEPHRKGDGIAYITKELALSRDEVLGFGDDVQDITMGDSAIFVCVGNGKEEAKAEADYVSPAIVDDGLTVALEKYGVL